jgi:hypothetical protein
MADFDIEITYCQNVYWASTDEYTLEVNGNEHTIRYAEDDNGGEMLYLGPDGWSSIFDYEDDPEVAAIIEQWQDGDLDLYCG